jgi:single-strand DNA-binding protein
MANLNKVLLMGNLTRDPELTHTASNMAICKFGMAINRKWRDRASGEMREETCYVDCVAFGRTGELINQYVAKGHPLFVEGRLHYRQWEGQDGTRRSKLEVVVDNMQFLSAGGGQGGRGAGQSSGYSGRPASPAPARAAASPQSMAPPPSDDPPIDDDYGPPADESNVPF